MPDGNADNTTVPFDMPMLPNAQDIELLDFDFNAGIESIDVLNDLLNASESDETALPLIRSTYVPEKKCSALYITSLPYSRITYSE